MKQKKKSLFGMHSLLAVIALMLAASIYASCSSDDDDYDNGWVELETMARGTRSVNGENYVVAIIGGTVSGQENIEGVNDDFYVSVDFSWHSSDHYSHSNASCDLSIHNPIKTFDITPDSSVQRKVYCINSTTPSLNMHPSPSFNMIDGLIKITITIDYAKIQYVNGDSVGVGVRQRKSIDVMADISEYIPRN